MLFYNLLHLDFNPVIALQLLTITVVDIMSVE